MFVFLILRSKDSFRPLHGLTSFILFVHFSLCFCYFVVEPGEAVHREEYLSAAAEPRGRKSGRWTEAQPFVQGRAVL